MTTRMVAVARRLLEEWSSEQLAALVKAKKLYHRITSLTREKQHLESLIRRKTVEIARVDRTIARLLRPAVRPSAPRTKQSPLRDFVVTVLRKAKTPLSLDLLAQALLRAGYRTRSDSKNFKVSVAHLLKRMRAELRRTTRGYSLRTAASSTRTRRASHRRPSSSQPAASAASPKPAAMPGPAAAAGK